MPRRQYPAVFHAQNGRAEKQAGETRRRTREHAELQVWVEGKQQCSRPEGGDTGGRAGEEPQGFDKRNTVNKLFIWYTRVKPKTICSSSLGQMRYILRSQTRVGEQAYRGSGNESIR